MPEDLQIRLSRAPYAPEGKGMMGVVVHPATFIPVCYSAGADGCSTFLRVTVS